MTIAQKNGKGKIKFHRDGVPATVLLNSSHVLSTKSPGTRKIADNRIPERQHRIQLHLYSRMKIKCHSKYGNGSDSKVGNNGGQGKVGWNSKITEAIQKRYVDKANVTD